VGLRQIKGTVMASLSAKAIASVSRVMENIKQMNGNKFEVAY